MEINVISSIENQVEFVQEAIKIFGEDFDDLGDPEFVTDYLFIRILYDENEILCEYLLFLKLTIEIEDIVGFLAELLKEYSEDKTTFILTHGNDPFHLKSFSNRIIVD